MNPCRPSLLFGLCLDRWGVGALWLSAGLGLLAFGALLMLPRFAHVRNEPGTLVPNAGTTPST